MVHFLGVQLNKVCSRRRGFMSRSDRGVKIVSIDPAFVLQIRNEGPNEA